MFKSRLSTQFVFCILIALLLPSASWAGNIALYSSKGTLYLNEKDVNTPKEAVEALLAGPTEAEKKAGLSSMIPAEVKLNRLDVLDRGVLIDLSQEAAAGLDDYRLDQMFRQFLWTMKPFGLEEQVILTIDGREPSIYLKPLPEAVYSAPKDEEAFRETKVGAVGLSGKRITLSPGHGWTWIGTHWATMRGRYCNYEQEDIRNGRNVAYLKVYLENDGAYVQPTREFDFTRGNGPSGHPWWQEAAYAWLFDQGYSCNVYAGSSGSCGTVTGPDRKSDDIRARPLASNLDGRGNTDIYVSLHTNGASGGCYGTACPTGIDGYYMNTGSHASWGSQSIDLAQRTQDATISAVQNAGFNIGHHGSTGALYGNFGEIRVPQRPAALLELGFHDSCDTDAPIINDPLFQSCAAWGVYKGICEYFGNTPTYSMYDSEYISNTIPDTMVAGEKRTVQITFKNKGALWNDSYGFKLGAIGDSDHMAGTIRQNIAGGVTVQNNDTYTFTFEITAPMTPANYTTDWQMIREGYDWFGETFSRDIYVSGSGFTATPSNTPTSTPLPDPRFYNRVDNGGFENDFNGWTKGSATTEEIVTSGAHRGNKACKFYRDGGYATIWQDPGESMGESWTTSCWAYYAPGMTSTEFGFKDQGGSVEASATIDSTSWKFYSVNWNIADNIDVQAWGTGVQGVFLDDVRAGPTSKMNWITGWIWNGPHDSGSSANRMVTDYFAAEGGETAIEPRYGYTNGGHQWKTVTSGDGFIDLNKAMGSSQTNVVTYAHVYIAADSDKSGINLLIGSDDGVRVFLNGTIVHENNASRTQDYFNPDTDVVRNVSLKEGLNRMMIKVRQGSGDFSFSARFADDNGNAVPGLTYSVDPTVNDIIIESRAGGKNNNRYRETGEWADTTVDCTAAGCSTGIGMRYGSTSLSEAGEKSAFFTPDITLPGIYKVYAAWGAASLRRSGITHKVVHSGGTSEYFLDQDTNFNQWVSLGEHTFLQGTSGHVEVTNEDKDESGNMYAGAVKFEFVEPLAPTATPTNTPVPVQGNWQLFY